MLNPITQTIVSPHTKQSNTKCRPIKFYWRNAEIGSVYVTKTLTANGHTKSNIICVFQKEGITTPLRNTIEQISKIKENYPQPLYHTSQESQMSFQKLKKHNIKTIFKPHSKTK